jgi:hypothetical protein
MLPSIYKGIIEEYLPLLMHQLTATVGHKWRTRGFLASDLHSGEFFEGIWKLWRNLSD